MDPRGGADVWADVSGAITAIGLVLQIGRIPGHDVAQLRWPSDPTCRRRDGGAAAYALPTERSELDCSHREPWSRTPPAGCT